MTSGAVVEQERPVAGGAAEERSAAHCVDQALTRVTVHLRDDWGGSPSEKISRGKEREREECGS